MRPAIEISEARLADFCRKWKLVELSLFGSVVRDDFGPDSDVDVLVAFEPGAPWDAFDWPDMQDEFSALFGGRQIDLVERRSVINPFRRHEILTTRKVLYAA